MKKLIVFVLITGVIYFGFPGITNNTKAESLFIGDGNYTFTQGQRIQLDNGTIIEPTYNTSPSNCLIDVPCISFKVYDNNSTYIGQTIGNASLLAQDLSVGGHRFVATIHNMNSNNGAWTASITLTSIYEDRCISWTYSEWSSCSNGQKTRTILSSHPSGCTGGIPDLVSTCFNEPSHIGDGTYTIHEFETIRLSNGAILEPVFDRPLNVYFISFKIFDDSRPEQIGTINPIRVGTAVPIDTTIGSNYRVRIVLNSLTFNNDVWAASVTFTSLYEPQCTSFTYSNWSNCYNNQQTRSILTSNPINCIGGNPITVQSCVSPQYNGDGTYNVKAGDRIHLSNGAYIEPGYMGNNSLISEVVLRVLDNNQVDLNISPSIRPNDAPKNFTVGNYTFRASVTNIAMQNNIWTSTITLLSLNEPNACTSFTYEDWSECTNGWKLRKITSRLPENCVDVNGISITRQACESNNTTNTQTQQNQNNNSQKPKTNTKVDKVLSNKLRGKLLLDVENKGRIFYVNPKDSQKYEVTFANALPLFQKLSLGISNQNLDQISTSKSTTLGKQLAGKLLLQVEDKGRIWYIDSNGKKHEVTWANLMDLFKSLSLGVNTENLNKIEENTTL